MKYNSTNKNMASEHTCDFCNRSFIRETTLIKHICENKRRFQDKDKPCNRIGFMSWIHFYKKNTNKKKTEYMDFVKSSYYTAFIKFGMYCVDASVLNPIRYLEWLLDNKISVDNWNRDTHYTKFIVEYLKTEDPLDAVARSIETTIKLSTNFKIQSNDVLRYGNKNVICHEITKGQISPWLLYHSESGIKFLETIDVTQQKMIIDYINPEVYAIKFKKYDDVVLDIRKMLNIAGY
jgi:hypothetical protein